VRKKYQEAIFPEGIQPHSGKIEKKGDIFNLLLGNLSPGKKAIMELIMVGELAIEPDGAVRFVLPTVLKPRYTPLGYRPLAPVQYSTICRYACFGVLRLVSAAWYMSRNVIHSYLQHMSLLSPRHVVQHDDINVSRHA
jgi:hypothetical protein